MVFGHHWATSNSAAGHTQKCWDNVGLWGFRCRPPDVRQVLVLPLFLTLIIVIFHSQVWMTADCHLDKHFPIISDAEHLFTCLLSIYRSSLEKFPARLPVCLVGLFVFCC